MEFMRSAPGWEGKSLFSKSLITIFYFDTSFDILFKSKAANWHAWTKLGSLSQHRMLTSSKPKLRNWFHIKIQIASFI